MSLTQRTMARETVEVYIARKNMVVRKIMTPDELLVLLRQRRRRYTENIEEGRVVIHA